MKETHKKSQIQLNPIDSIAIHLASSVKRLDSEIKKNIQDKEIIVTNIASHLIMGKSKKIRPLLTLLFAKILKYKGSAHFNLAICIEFIHNATLLHDDVIDDAKIRRGKKAANLIWGNKLSILVGDYLLSKSFKLMVKDKSIKVLEILSNTSLILARGQIQDANNISNAHLTEKDYLELIFAKTAELFSVSCYLPAVLANKSLRIQNELKDFGKNFGMAFQLSDDYLDYFGNSKKMGKNIGKDFLEGKITYPLIHCHRNTSKTNQIFLNKILKKRRRNNIEFLKVLKIMELSNTKLESLKFTNKYLKKAQNSIKRFEGDSDKVYLDNLINYLLIRDH
jgi:octaprenyl-diphosphate synthase